MIQDSCDLDFSELPKLTHSSGVNWGKNVGETFFKYCQITGRVLIIMAKIMYSQKSLSKGI